ncbi:MAG: phosphodiesterase [bacterium]|nr:phosphodiesterase [Deltaproteobacteria bacterium]MCP4903523.1 phosphodiesterase [bacterium]
MDLNGPIGALSEGHTGWIFPAIALATWVAVPAYAALARGRLYALFAGVLLTVSLPAALVLHTRLREIASADLGGWLDFLFAYSMAAAGLQFAHLVRARMRGSLFRWLVSVPGQTFIAAGMLAGPWLLALLPFRLLFDVLGWTALLSAWTLLESLPLAVSLASILTSVTTRPETVRFRLSRQGPEEMCRIPVERYRGRPPAPLLERPLRVVQLTDTHLGPWQSIDRLRRRIASLVEREPDLVVLTGDFLTMESMGSPGCLEDALEPLTPVAERCVAILGNHDHEAPHQIRAAMRNIGIRLLVDEEACFETAVADVQVVGADYVGRGHREHLGALLARYPRREDHLRLLLLHDPVGFRALPANDVDLVLSGHTHGGQVGLVSLGIDWTVLSPSRWPDQGLFAQRSTRLYVHRGTGFYGFPMRIGVPAEQSVLEISPA